MKPPIKVPTLGLISDAVTLLGVDGLGSVGRYPVDSLASSASVAALSASVDSISGDYATGTALTALQAEVDGLVAIQSDLTFIGGWDASDGVFPTSTTAGEYWITETAGTVDGVSFAVGDKVIATVEDASTTTFVGNWLRDPAPQFDAENLTLTGETTADSLVVDGLPVAPTVKSAAGADWLWPDPFFKRVRLGEDFDGRDVWLGDVAANWEFVDNAVFPNGRALQSDDTATGLTGPIIPLPASRFPAGSDLTVRMLVVGDVGVTVSTGARWYDGGSNLGGDGISANEVTATSIPQMVTVTCLAAPEGVDGLRLYPYVKSGTGTFRILAMWAYLGQDGPAWPVQDRALDPLREPRPDTYRPQMPRLASKLVQGQWASVAFLGDSWTNDPVRIMQPVQSRIAEQWSVTSAGYISTATSAIFEPPLCARSRSGVWVESDFGPGFGPDGAHATTDEVGASFTVDPDSGAVNNAIRLHYLQQPGGGTIDCRAYDSGSEAVQTVQTVDTDGALSYQTVTIPHTSGYAMTFQVATAGSGVTIMGAEILNIAAGEVAVHKIGNGGATAADFLTIPEDYFGAAMTAIAPDCVFLTLGTNDMSGSVPPREFREQIALICDRIRAAKNLCDIILVAPAQNGLTDRVYRMQDYADALFDLARDQGFGFVDLFGVFGPNPVLPVSAGVYQNDFVHPNQFGGQMIAGHLWDACFRRLT
ncbi:hypothetical protein GCM10022290_09590 [Sagittula marina]